MSFLSRNKKWLIIILASIAVVLLLSGKDKNNVVSNNTEQLAKNVLKPRGSRLLGMGISEGKIGFEKAFALAQGVGVKVIELPTSWDDSEPEARQYIEGYWGQGIGIGVRYWGQSPFPFPTISPRCKKNTTK